MVIKSVAFKWHVPIVFSHECVNATFHCIDYTLDMLGAVFACGRAAWGGRAIAWGSAGNVC